MDKDKEVKLSKEILVACRIGPVDSNPQVNNRQPLCVEPTAVNRPVDSQSAPGGDNPASRCQLTSAQPGPTEGAPAGAPGGKAETGKVKEEPEPKVLGGPGDRSHKDAGNTSSGSNKVKAAKKNNPGAHMLGN